MSRSAMAPTIPHIGHSSIEESAYFALFPEVDTSPEVGRFGQFS
jgi:hypothetical protein